MTTSTDIIFADEATSDGTSELHLSADEAAAIKGFGKVGDSATGISDEEVAAGMQAFIDDNFGGASVDKTDPTGIAPTKRTRPVRPALADTKKPAKPQRKTPKIGVAAIREEARATQANAEQDNAGKPNDSTVILKDQKPSEPARPFQIPAIAKMDPRLDKYADEARQWMFAADSNSHKENHQSELSVDDVAITLAPEYRRLTAGERRKLYKSRMRELNRQKIRSRQQRKQAGQSGSSLFDELAYRLGALKARFGRSA